MDRSYHIRPFQQHQEPRAQLQETRIEPKQVGVTSVSGVFLFSLHMIFPLPTI